MKINQRYVKVWDAPVRIFHWATVLGVIGAYLSAKFHVGLLHTMIGYTLTFFLITRIIWGFIGNQYARFSSFLYSPSTIITYVQTIVRGSPAYFYGHNPAGAVMVFALLTFMALILLTGLATLAMIDFEGPFYFLLEQVNDNISYLVHHLHNWLVDGLLILVLFHILGVAFSSFQHQENLVYAMITGVKRKYSAHQPK